MFIFKFFSPRSDDFFKGNHVFFKLFAAKRRLFLGLILSFFRREAAFFLGFLGDFRGFLHYF